MKGLIVLAGRPIEIQMSWLFGKNVVYLIGLNIIIGIGVIIFITDKESKQ